MGKENRARKQAARTQNARRERNVGHSNGEEHSKKAKGRDRGRNPHNKH